jgi:hypothetical protein
VWLDAAWMLWRQCAALFNPSVPGVQYIYHLLYDWDTRPLCTVRVSFPAILSLSTDFPPLNCIHRLFSSHAYWLHSLRSTNLKFCELKLRRNWVFRRSHSAPSFRRWTQQCPRWGSCLGSLLLQYFFWLVLCGLKGKQVGWTREQTPRSVLMVHLPVCRPTICPCKYPAILVQLLPFLIPRRTEFEWLSYGVVRLRNHGWIPRTDKTVGPPSLVFSGYRGISLRG